MIRNSITVLRKAPYPITAKPLSVASFSELTGFPDKLMKRFEKSTLPRKIPRNGMSRLLTAELTILQKCGANNADGKVN